jgi:hypothetical protein
MPHSMSEAAALVITAFRAVRACAHFDSPPVSDPSLMLPDWSISTKIRSRHGAPHSPEAESQRLSPEQSVSSQAEPSDAQRRCRVSLRHSDIPGVQTEVTQAPRRQARSG